MFCGASYDHRPTSEQPGRREVNDAAPSTDCGCFAKAVEPMAQAQDRMPPQHARAGITHHRSDLLAPGTLIAVNRTLGAKGFSGPKPAALQPGGGIIQQPLTLRAKRRPGSMMDVAVTANAMRTEQGRGCRSARSPAAGDGLGKCAGKRYREAAQDSSK
jgi:hypothetical protein